MLTIDMYEDRDDDMDDDDVDNQDDDDESLEVEVESPCASLPAAVVCCEFLRELSDEDNLFFY